MYLFAGSTLILSKLGIESSYNLLILSTFAGIFNSVNESELILGMDFRSFENTKFVSFLEEILQSSKSVTLGPYLREVKSFD